MANVYANPKTGEEFEADADYDTSTGEDRNVSQRGYRRLHDIVNPKTNEVHAVDDQQLKDSLTKGYVLKAQHEANDNKPDTAQIAKYGSVGKDEATLRGLSQAIPLGDELAGAGKNIVGAVKTAGEYLNINKTDEKDPDVIEYKKGRDLARARNEEAAKNYPGSFYGSQLLGGAQLGGATGLVEGTAAKIGVGAAEGAAIGSAASSGKTIGEDKGNIALGGALGAIPGVVSGVSGMVKSRLMNSGGGKGAQFIDNPANVETAKHATNINAGLKQDIRNQSVKSAQDIESGLGGLRQKTNDAYRKLKQELETLDQPVHDPDSSPSRIAYDKMKAALNDPEITDIDKSHIRQVMDKTFIKNPEARNVVETGLQPTKQSPSYDNMLQGEKPTFGVEEYQYTPGSTLGENLQTSVELKRNLGEKAFKDNPNADSIARTSAHKMKALQQDVANTVDQGFAKEGLTNSEALYNDALGAAKTEIPARNILRKKLGSKIPGEQNNTISADKVRTAMTRSDDAIKQKLMDRAKVAGADEGLTDIANKNQQIQQNQMLQSDWNRLNTPNGLVASGIHSIPLIGKALPTTTGQAIQAYNTVKHLFNNSALASAVRALTQDGRTLSRATIANLAAQHNVDPIQLEQTIRDNGN